MIRCLKSCIRFDRKEAIHMEDKVRGILERVRGAAQQAGEAAGATARQASRKAGNMLDVTRLNVQIYELNSDIATLLKSAGQIVYDAHLGVDTDEAMLNNILSQLDEKNGQVMELRARIDGLKNVRECPCCGAPCTPGDRFCKSCGVELS